MTSEADQVEGNSAAQVSSLLAQLEGDLRACTSVDVSVEGSFANVLKGCFLKAFEFATLVHETLKPGIAFFVAPSLRGICEDYIALKYLYEKRTRDQCDGLLTQKAMHQLKSAADKQVAFFKRARPYQPVYSVNKWTEFQAANHPNVRSMATAVALDDLYDFMYAITSDVVHFNPRVIIRNAWGEHPKYSHSVSHFDQYYLSMCRVYGLYFLCTFADTFAAEFTLSPDSKVVILRLAQSLEDELRWPEAVTYEEMNLESPSDILRVIAKAAHRVEHDSESADEPRTEAPPKKRS